MIILFILQSHRHSDLFHLPAAFSGSIHIDHKLGKCLAFRFHSHRQGLSLLQLAVHIRVNTFDFRFAFSLHQDRHCTYQADTGPNHCSQLARKIRQLLQRQFIRILLCICHILTVNQILLLRTQKSSKLIPAVYLHFACNSFGIYILCRIFINRHTCITSKPVL